MVLAFLPYSRSDHIQSGVYERQLRKNDVAVISITQPTAEDAAGEMLRSVIRLFDEHQSRETSKHTHRSMCENARQGFYNGCRSVRADHRCLDL